MLRAHRQAWAWQDEWVGLTIDDIRKLELETKLILQSKLGRPLEVEGRIDADIQGGEDTMNEDLHKSDYKVSERVGSYRCVCVCVCVRERKRGREKFIIITIHCHYNYISFNYHLLLSTIYTLSPQISKTLVQTVYILHTKY